MRPGRKLRVVVHLPADFWHVPPSPPTGEWVEAVELVVIREPDEAVAALKDVLGPRTAVIGEADAALPGLVPTNPEALLHRLHWARACKTPWSWRCAGLAPCGPGPPGRTRCLPGRRERGRNPPRLTWWRATTPTATCPTPASWA